MGRGGEGWGGVGRGGEGWGGVGRGGEGWGGVGKGGKGWGRVGRGVGACKGACACTSVHLLGICRFDEIVNTVEGKKCWIQL